MTWFVAHAMMVLRPIEPIEEPLFCWENLLLIEARDGDDAWNIAELRARSDSTDEFELHPPYAVPSRWELAGIRKVVEVLHEMAEDQLSTGDELSYNTIFLANQDELDSFVSGKKCLVTYGDDYPGNGLDR